jgi:hypothetical protein
MASRVMVFASAKKKAHMPKTSNLITIKMAATMFTHEVIISPTLYP